MKQARLIKKDTITQLPQTKTAKPRNGIAELRKAALSRKSINPREALAALFNGGQSR